MSWLVSVGHNSCSLVTLCVCFRAFKIVSWWYSLQMKNKYICICGSNKCWGSLCILFSLRNYEYGIEFLRLIGCSEQKFKFLCLSVTLVYNLVYNLLPLMYIIRSRNGISMGEISPVNFKVECTVFKWFMNSRSESIPCGHMRKMSSINLFHNFGCRGYVHTYFSSNFVRNRLGYEGTNLVPIAVPDTCW